MFGTAWLMVTMLLGLVPSWRSLLPSSVISPPSEQLLGMCNLCFVGHRMVALPGREDLLNVIQADTISIFQLSLSTPFSVNVWQGLLGCVADLPMELGEVQLFRLQVPGGTTEGIKGIGGPDICAQHVQGVVLVAILLWRGSPSGEGTATIQLLSAVSRPLGDMGLCPLALAVTL